MRKLLLAISALLLLSAVCGAQTSGTINCPGVNNPGSQSIGGCGGPSAVSFHGPGSIGFLPTCSSTLDYTNLLLQSQSFTTAPWTLFSAAGPAVPTLTANAALAPDSTMTATRMDLPSVSGAGARSAIYQGYNTQYTYYPMTVDIWVKGVVGGEKLWLVATNNGVDPYPGVAITATTSWQRFSFTFGSTNTNQYIELGVSLTNSAETAQPAQSVYIWGAQAILEPTEQAYVPTTTTAATGTTTLTCPSGIDVQRDYVGNILVHDWQG